MTEDHVEFPNTLKWFFFVQKHALHDFLLTLVLMACHCPPSCQQLLLSHPSLQTTPSCKNYLKQRRAFSNQTFFVLSCFVFVTVRQLNLDHSLLALCMNALDGSVPHELMNASWIHVQKGNCFLF